MGESWIDDAIRTPRGRAENESGAPSGIHQQRLLGEVQP